MRTALHRSGRWEPRPAVSHEALLESIKQLFFDHLLKRGTPLPIDGEAPLDVVPELHLPPDTTLKGTTIQEDADDEEDDDSDDEPSEDEPAPKAEAKTKGQPTAKRGRPKASGSKHAAKRGRK